MTLLVLVHIPKTAGTALSMILHHHYGMAFVGGIGHHSTTPRRRLAPNVFSRFKLAKRRLQALGQAAKPRAIAGHITFGLHHLLPPDARYLTILRDPVERTLSHYYYLVRPAKRSQAGVGFTAPWLPPPSPKLTLQECFERGYLLDNLQTRMICGLASPYEELPASALDDAKRNLAERFAYVGTTERFPEYLALLNLELGWPAVAYRRIRTNSARPRGDAVPLDVRLVAEERNMLDRALYDHADQLLGAAIDAAGPEVELEAEVLRRAAEARGAERSEVAARRRALPLDARVELALTEAEVAEATLRFRRLKSKIRARRPAAVRIERRRAA